MSNAKNLSNYQWVSFPVYARPIKNIATAFGLNRYGGAFYAIHKISRLCERIKPYISLSITLSIDLIPSLF